MQMRFSLLIAMLAAMLVGCSQEPGTEETAQAQQSQAQPDPHANINMQAATGGGTPHSGKVVFVTQAAGYTYLRVESGGKFIWLASNQANVQEGDIASWGQSATMRNFTSKALNRTFDEILFVGAVNKADPAKMAANNPNSGTVVTTMNSAGYSYIEVKQASGNTWIAVPQTQVKVGDKVSWSGGAVMPGFTSSSLNRTFDQIIFAGGITVLN